MKNHLYAFIGILTVISCEKKDYNINLAIDNLGYQSLIIYSQDISTYPKGKLEIDTIIADDDDDAYLNVKSAMSHLIITPIKHAKYFGESMPKPDIFSLEFFVAPHQRIQINGKLSDTKLTYEVVNPQDINYRYANLRNQYISILESEEDIKKARLDMQQQNDSITNIQKNYIQSNLDDNLSGFLLLKQPRQFFLKYYNQLSDKVRNKGLFSLPLTRTNTDYINAERLSKRQKSITEGSIAPDFSLSSINDEIINLADIKGRYILLDFWETWCEPAIQAFPRLEDYRKKYKGKLKIVNIACDYTPEKWKKLITKRKFPWVQLINKSTDEFDNNNIIYLYAISGYPTRFVLDKNKKILLKFVGESDQFYNKLDNLMKK